MSSRYAVVVDTDEARLTVNSFVQRRTAVAVAAALRRFGRSAFVIKVEVESETIGTERASRGGLYLR